MTLPNRSGDAVHDDPLFMTFRDNAVLPALFGRHDEHLTHMEKALGVDMVLRGNQLAISGPPGSMQAAKRVLSGLLRRLEQGLEVNAAEVTAAVRMVDRSEAASKGAGDNSGENLFIAAPKTRIGPRSLVQADYMRALRDYDLVFALGPAGTGKTYLAVAQAVAMLITGRVERIVLSRPAVEAGENLGFLPGDLREKIDPYLRPLYDALHDMMHGENLRHHIDAGNIEVAPLAFMRGRTLTNAFVILDEAQNTSPTQMKMCLTRLGENARMVVTGDPSQIDLPKNMGSGLDDAVRRLKGVAGVTMVTFSDVDVLRHDLVTRIIRAYDRASESES